MVTPEMVDTREMAIYVIPGIDRLIGIEEAILEKTVGINLNVAKNEILTGIVKIIGIIIEIVKIKLIDILGILSLKTRILETRILKTQILGIPTQEIPTLEIPILGIPILEIPEPLNLETWRLLEPQKSLETRIPETTTPETRNLTPDPETRHPRHHPQPTDNHQPTTTSQTLAHLPLSKTNTFAGKTAKPWPKSRRLNF